MKRFALAALLALAPLAASAECTKPANASRLMADAAAAVNAARRANGRAALAHSAKLDQAAMSHACWMAETRVFSHKGAGGSLPKKRIKATGYRTRLTAENIAWGQSSGAEVVQVWMDSPGHRRNILLSSLDEYGLGVALMNGRVVWVMDYAAK